MIDLSEPRRTSPWTPALTAVDVVRQFLLPLVVIVAFGAGDGFQSLFNAIGVVGVFAATRIVAWLRQRWWVEDDRLRVRSGLLQVDDRTIPIDRIQRIDRNQTLLSRLVGLYELKAETAGGSGSELSLRYLSESEIDAVEHWLGSRRIAESEPAAEEEVLSTTPFRDLVIGGATANRIGALAVLAGSAFQIFDDATENTFELLDRWFPAIAEPFSTGSGAILAGVILVSAALVVGWIASIAATILRYFEFELVLTNGELRRTHGMLSRFQASSPLHRIQAVRIEQPVLRRIVGYASTVAETAGSPGEEREGAGTLTPIAPRAHAIELTARVVGPSYDEIARLESVSHLTLRRGFVRAVLMLSVPTIGAVFLLRDGGWIGRVTPSVVAVVVAMWYSRARYRAIGYRLTADHVVTREGVLTRTWWSVPMRKVQTVAVRRSPFQRRLGLASVSIDTAGGRAPIRIVDLPDSIASEVASAIILRSTASFNIDAV